MGYTHLGHLILEHVIQTLDQGFLLLGNFFLGLLVLFGVQLAQIQIATGNVDKGLAVELGQVAHHPLVDAVGQQQHLDTLLAEHFQMRAVLDVVVAVTGQVVDLVLALLQAAHIISQRNVLGAVGTLG